MGTNAPPLVSAENQIGIFNRPSSFTKNAIFISYSSLVDFQNCQRAYCLKNIYHDPMHGYRIQIASPYLTLGSLVHDTIRWYQESSEKPTSEQTIKQFRNFWGKYRGKRGGFASLEEEARFGKRGLMMLENYLASAAVLGRSMPVASFPKFTIEDNLVFTGNMDYVEALADGTLHVIDFKTGAKNEDSPIQLCLYALVAESHYRRKVTKASFWYLDRQSRPKEVVLEPREQTFDWLKGRAEEIKQARLENIWKCCQLESPCRDCRDYGAIIEGRGEFLFTDERYKKEIYFLDRSRAFQEAAGESGTSAKVL